MICLRIHNLVDDIFFGFYLHLPSLILVVVFSLREELELNQLYSLKYSSQYVLLIFRETPWMILLEE